MSMRQDLEDRVKGFHELLKAQKKLIEELEQAIDFHFNPSNKPIAPHLMSKFEEALSGTVQSKDAK